MTRPPSLAGYTTREVARLLGLTESRVRSWVRSGFISPRRGPRREYRFSFQDLVVLRTARELMAARVPAVRVRRALQRLRRELPAGRSLAAVRIAAEGARVVVHEGPGSWEPDSGQRRLDFDVAELARRAAPLAPRALARARRTEGLDAEDWYALGWELEPTAPGEAADAYGHALELDAGHADAHLNLGRLLHEEGRLGEAERHYRRSTELRPTDATAAFNLGVALQDLGRRREAIEAYRKAVRADPACADAHYNLAGLYEELGERAAAIRSLKAYRSLTR